MRKLRLYISLLLSIFLIDHASAQNSAIDRKGKKTDKKVMKQDTSRLDTTDLGTKTGRGTIGSGTTMTDTSSVTPPDKIKTDNGTSIQPGSGTEDPGRGTIDPGEVNPGTVNPGTGTSEPTGKAPLRRK